jgi:hypothetical protein
MLQINYPGFPKLKNKENPCFFVILSLYLVKIIEITHLGKQMKLVLFETAENIFYSLVQVLIFLRFAQDEFSNLSLQLSILMCQAQAIFQQHNTQSYSTTRSCQ